MAGTSLSYSLLPSAARTLTVTSPAQSGLAWRGLHLVIDLTVRAAAETITPKIQCMDANGIWYDLTSALTATGAVGTYVYKFYPGMTVSAGVDFSTAIPADFRVVLTHSGSGAHTYSVGVNLIH
jgi:hypothetical protein